MLYGDSGLEVDFRISGSSSALIKLNVVESKSFNIIYKTKKRLPQTTVGSFWESYKEVVLLLLEKRKLYLSQWIGMQFSFVTREELFWHICIDKLSYKNINPRHSMLYWHQKQRRGGIMKIRYLKTGIGYDYIKQGGVELNRLKEGSRTWSYVRVSDKPPLKNR